MNPRIRKLLVALLLLVAAVSVTVRLQNTQDTNTSLVLGLDHIPLAVMDLDNAAERYRELGFTLKPGKPHENGIQNQHVKFADGTEIELITVPEARDSLTAEYVRHLASGDGAAFVGFYAPDMDRLAGRLDAEGRTYHWDGGLLTFPESDGLRYTFFGQRTSSPTDRPEHFEHRNGAEALIGVWIAGDDLASEHQLFVALGATFFELEVHIPGSTRATVAKLQQAEVVFLPGSYQLVPGRRIVGATVRTHDLDDLRRVLTAASWNIPPVVQTSNGCSMFLPPSITHGIWLEFRQERCGAATWRSLMGEIELNRYAGLIALFMAITLLLTGCRERVRMFVERAKTF
ncbi:MAG: VOC family protein [Chloroflexi bacterium]|nr:VOC family protein [Chloroflexota bacterium]